MKLWKKTSFRNVKINREDRSVSYDVYGSGFFPKHYFSGQANIDEFLSMFLGLGWEIR